MANALQLEAARRRASRYGRFFLAISQLPIKILLIRIQRRRFHKRSNDLAIEQRLHTATLTSDTLP